MGNDQKYAATYSPAQSAVIVALSSNSASATWYQPKQAAAYVGIRRYSAGHTVQGYSITGSTYSGGSTTLTTCVGTTSYAVLSSASAIGMGAAIALVSVAALF